jgi:hypothetical protein
MILELIGAAEAAPFQRLRENSIFQQTACGEQQMCQSLTAAVSGRTSDRSWIVWIRAEKSKDPMRGPLGSLIAQVRPESFQKRFPHRF